MAGREYNNDSKGQERVSQNGRDRLESGSWSDVSDHFDCPTSYDSYSRTGHSYHGGSNDLSERLYSSLDLGHGSFYLVDPTFSDGFSGFSSLPEQRMTNGSVPTATSSVSKNYKHTKSKSNGSAAQIENEQSYGVKTKFLSAWNNMRHGWTVKTRTSFSYNQPLWLLGRWYSSTPQEREEIKRQQEKGILVISPMEKFKRDFTSRIWFTYRQDFPPVHGTTITSDVGWGCMLRSAQMIMAQALVMHFLGREWRWYPHQNKQDILYHHKIISFFGDSDSDECPLSVHSLAKIGEKHGKKPGDWYGPASVAYVLRDAIEQVPDSYPILSQMCIYVAPDCTVYKQDVIDLCTRRYGSGSRHTSTSDVCSSPTSQRSGSHSAVEHWRALVLLIPVRLGGEALNPVYTPAIQTILANDMCLGIIGGKPKHSVFFVGFQDDKLIYMDPHFCQDTVNVKDIECSLESYHCMSPRKMSFSKMDPSCTIGFYCKTRMDFENLCLEAAQMSAPSSKGLYPMFIVTDGRSSDLTTVISKEAGQVLKIQRTDKKGRIKQNSKDSDDFVFL